MVARPRGGVKLLEGESSSKTISGNFSVASSVFCLLASLNTVEDSDLRSFKRKLFLYVSKCFSLWFLSLIYITLMASDAEHPFICLWVLSMSSLKKCLFRSFADFLNWIVCLPGVELCEFFIYLGDQTLVWDIIGKCVFPYGWFPFHFADVFFNCAEAFYFDEVPICLFFPLCPLF